MKPHVTFLLLLATTLVGMSGTSLLAATDIAGSFDAANKLYEEGKFTDAVAAYEKAVRSGSVSPALYYNLGNAFFKSGQTGRAIVAYRQAERLSPRDPELRANLQFVRDQVQGPTLRVTRWESWLATLSLNEWSWLSASAVWLTFLLLAVMQLKPQTKRVLRSYVWLVASAAMVLSAFLGCALAHRYTVETAVVTAPDVVARQGPLEESQSAFTVHDGAELRVLDRKNDWLQVTDKNRRIGWLKQGEVSVLDHS